VSGNVVNSLDLGLGKVLTSAKGITAGVAKDASNLLPTPEGLFESGKNLIAGYPFEFASTAINKICSSALSTNNIAPKTTPDINIMNFQLRTSCKKYSFPLLKASDMWNSPEFDPSKKVVILVTGWTNTINESAVIDAISQAYNCRGDYNFVALDAASFVDTLYTWSAFNTDAIGEYMATGLKELSEIVPIENIHLIGHSLGAHIVGSAAKYFNERTGKKIPRITGLDPAKPCFNEGEALSGLLRGYSEFVDVIHSNPGVLGKRDPLGDVDFYPGGLDPLPPGCVDITCAHARAWEFYAESTYPGNENNFMGQRCSSLTKLRENKCPGKQIPMGFAVDMSYKGNYFLEVDSMSPFGKNGDKAREAKNENCGVCA